MADTIRRACRASDDSRLRSATIFEGDLHELSLDAVLDDGDCVNAAWIDVGTIHADDARWVTEELAPALCHGSTVAFTLAKNRRFPVLNRTRQLLDAAGAHYLRWARQVLNGAPLVANTTPVKDKVDVPYQAGRETALVNFMLHGRTVSRRYSDVNLYQLALLRAMFANHNFDVELCLSYPGESQGAHGKRGGLKYTVLGLTGFEPRSQSALDETFQDGWSRLLKGKCEAPGPHPEYGSIVQDVFGEGVARGAAARSLRSNMPASAYVTRLAELAGVPSPLSSTAA